MLLLLEKDLDKSQEQHVMMEPAGLQEEYVDTETRTTSSSISLAMDPQLMI